MVHFLCLLMHMQQTLGIFEILNTYRNTIYLPTKHLKSTLIGIYVYLLFHPNIHSENYLEVYLILLIYDEAEYSREIKFLKSMELLL